MSELTHSPFDTREEYELLFCLQCKRSLPQKCYREGHCPDCVRVGVLELKAEVEKTKDDLLGARLTADERRRDLQIVIDQRAAWVERAEKAEAERNDLRSQLASLLGQVQTAIAQAMLRAEKAEAELARVRECRRWDEFAAFEKLEAENAALRERADQH